jgi:hypothetical protein
VTRVKIVDLLAHAEITNKIEFVEDTVDRQACKLNYCSNDLTEMKDSE